MHEPGDMGGEGAIRRLLEWPEWEIIYLNGSKNGKKWTETSPRKSQQDMVS